MKYKLDPDNQSVEWDTQPGHIRKLYREDDYVIKLDNIRLDDAWAWSMEAILREWRLPAWVGFVHDGYKTHFIDGIDLHGNTPFSYSCGAAVLNLTIEQRMKVLDIFSEAIRIGKILGFTFGDINLSNLILKDNEIYLIDYDSIVSFPLPDDHARVWDRNLSLIFNTKE